MLVTLGRQVGERLDTAAANIILAGNIDVRRSATHFLGGLAQPEVEGVLALGGREVEVGGLDDAGRSDGLFGQGRSCTESQ